MSLARSLPRVFLCSLFGLGCQVESPEREARPPPRFAFEQQESTQDEPSGQALLHALEEYEQTNFDDRVFGVLLRQIDHDASLSRQQKIDALLHYAEQRTKGRDIVFAKLVRWQAEELGPWIRKNRASLRPNEFQDIFDSIVDHSFTTGVAWRDPNIAALACEKAISGDPDTRTEAVGLLSMIGTLDEVRPLGKRLEVEHRIGTRSALYRALARYDHAETNKHIRTQLTEHESRRVVDSVLRYGLVEYHRYDFLPDLRALRRKLQAVTDVREKGEAERMVDDIDEAIAELEQQKARKLPIGLPLDWPATKN